MKYTLQLVNNYLSHNRLLDKVFYIGGDTQICRVEMSLGVDLFALIKTIEKYRKVHTTLKICKTTKRSIITFSNRKEVA